MTRCQNNSAHRCIQTLQNTVSLSNGFGLVFMGVTANTVLTGTQYRSYSAGDRFAGVHKTENRSCFVRFSRLFFSRACRQRRARAQRACCNTTTHTPHVFTIHTWAMGKQCWLHFLFQKANIYIAHNFFRVIRACIFMKFNGYEQTYERTDKRTNEPTDKPLN